VADVCGMPVKIRLPEWYSVNQMGQNRLSGFFETCKLAQ
jgi:hypothetical protein